MAEPIGIFIYNGIFDRFPDLRIGTMESGVGWLAWYAEYNDRVWEKQRYWTESVIDKPPSYYMDQNVWASFIQDRAGILMRDLPGGRNIMWSSRLSAFGDDVPEQPRHHPARFCRGARGGYSGHHLQQCQEVPADQLSSNHCA